MMLYSHRACLSRTTLRCFLLLLALALLPTICAGQSADDGFDPNANDLVRALAVQPDGKIIVGGEFTMIAGQTRSRLARLNADGSIDSSFIATIVDSPIYAIAVQADGRIVIGGGFSQVGGSSRNRLARLNADGTLDTAFNPDVNNPVSALALQSDGKLVVGGNFTTIDGQPRNHIARLNANGTLDMAFNPNVDNFVYTLALQPDGKLVVSGIFSTIGTLSRHYLARLNADGTLDAGFNPNADSYVLALALQPDGKLVVAGNFTTINGQPRNSIARLSTPQAALQSLNIIGYTKGDSLITWARSGAGPELSLPPQFLFSVDGTTYAPAGTMQRTSSGWRSIGFVPPLSDNFYLRAQGQVSSGRNNGSSGLIESTRQFYLNGNDGIFIDGFE